MEQIKAVASQVDDNKLHQWAEQVVNNHRLMNSACRKPSLEQVIQLYKQALFLIWLTAIRLMHKVEAKQTGNAKHQNMRRSVIIILTYKMQR